MPRAALSPLARVREICLALPETTERQGHGAPSFLIRDRVCFLDYMDHTTRDGRLAFWCACPPGMRDGLVKAPPEQYFVPPYVGFRAGGVSRRRAEETRRDTRRIVTAP